MKFSFAPKPSDSTIVPIEREITTPELAAPMIVTLKKLSPIDKWLVPSVQAELQTRFCDEGPFLFDDDDKQIVPPPALLNRVATMMVMQNNLPDEKVILDKDWIECAIQAEDAFDLILEFAKELNDPKAKKSSGGNSSPNT